MNRFLPGNGGGGRPIGARNKLSSAALNDFLAEWQEGGRAAVKAFRLEDPGGFVRAVLGTLPKEFTIETITSDLSDTELDEMIARLRAEIAQEKPMPLTIEARLVERVEDEQ
jgi:hypothetical protein